MEHGKHYRLISSEIEGDSFDFKEIWKYRDLILLLVRRDFVSQYKQTILGPAWALIQPLLTTVVFTFIFGNVAGLANCGTCPTFLFYMCANVAWAFFAGTLTNTANTFINNSGTMGKVYFPRLCIPISTTMSQLISFGIQFAMFLIFLGVFAFIPGFDIETNAFVLMAPVLVLHMGLLGLGCGIIVSACTTKYRDLRFLVGFGVTLWMYATPVAYSISIFGNGILYQLCRFNPMTPIIEMFRYGFLGGQAGTLDWLSYGVSCVVTIIVLAFGVALFNKVERTFMDTV